METIKTPKIVIPLEPEVHKKLKLLSVEQDTTIKKIITNLIINYIKDNERVTK